MKKLIQCIYNSTHERWVDLLQSTTEWNKEGYHPEIGKVTLDDLLKSYNNHGEHHLNQILEIL